MRCTLIDAVFRPFFRGGGDTFYLEQSKKDRFTSKINKKFNCFDVLMLKIGIYIFHSEIGFLTNNFFPYFALVKVSKSCPICLYKFHIQRKNLMSSFFSKMIFMRRQFCSNGESLHTLLTSYYFCKL